MTANSIFLIAFAGLALAAYVLTLASIKCGFKWTGIAEIGLLKAFGFHLLFGLAVAVVATPLILAAVFAHIRLTEFALNALSFALQLIVPILVVVLWYRVRFWRAALSLVPLWVTGAATLLFALLVLRPLFYECYAIPTNGMAPTLLGEHLEAPCPNCGQPAYGSPPDEHSHLSPDGLQMICSKELQSVLVKDVPKTIGPGDRITVGKHITPKRWDLIVFRCPSDPSVKYIKRLVGLPGEKLEIKDGAIWINGERMEPPESIRGISYSPTVHAYGKEYSGPGSVPLELSSDEYFVLGDSVDASSDSRMWERGAPGHPPYAVPASHIVGVVINIYWPPNRWTSFR